MPLEALRSAAHVTVDAKSVAVGDGGNEVGMGKVVSVPGVGDLSPGGEFAALSVNGCVRSCDVAVLGTVSNWAGAKPTVAVDGSHNDRPIPLAGPREFYDNLWHLAGVTDEAKRQRAASTEQVQKLLLDDGDWFEWLGGWLALPILAILAFVVYLSLWTNKWRRVRQSRCCRCKKTTPPNLGGSVSAALTTVLAFVVSALAATQAIYLVAASKYLGEVLCSTDRILLGINFAGAFAMVEVQDFSIPDLVTVEFRWGTETFFRTEDRTHGRYVYRSRGTLDGKGGLRLQYQKLGYVPQGSTGHNLAK
eukprot:s505_g9.t1